MLRKDELGDANVGVDSESKMLVEDASHDGRDQDDDPKDDDPQDDESHDVELLPKEGVDQFENALDTLELKLSADELWNEYDP